MFIICPKCNAKYKIPAEITLSDGQKLKCSACQFIFSKGEEKPLILEKAIREEEKQPDNLPKIEKITVPNNEIGPIPVIECDAFSKPLYTQEDIPEFSQNSVPDAFQPTSPQKKKNYLWLIPVYILLLIILCYAGWMGRDLLKPQFSKMLPSVPVQDTQSLPQTENKVTLKTKSTSMDETISIPLFSEQTDILKLATENLEIEKIKYEINSNPAENQEELLIEGQIVNRTPNIQQIPELIVLVYDDMKKELMRKKIHLTTDKIEPNTEIPFYTGITPAPLNVKDISVIFANKDKP
jgi:hypothetical protein